MSVHEQVNVIFGGTVEPFELWDNNPGWSQCCMLNPNWSRISTSDSSTAPWQPNNRLELHDEKYVMYFGMLVQY